MRSYETARTIFGILEFVAWTAVVGGIIAAFAGANAGSYYSSSSAGLLGAVPGIVLSLIGLIAAATVQYYRAGVDSAEISGKMLRIAEEQLRIAKDAQKASYPANASFNQPLPSSSAQAAAIDKTEPTPERRQEAIASDGAPTELAKAVNVWDVEYRGRIIERTGNGMLVDGSRFADLPKARAHIDRLLEAQSAVEAPSRPSVES